MPDGSIYAGISPETNKPMYTTAADEPLATTWYKATQLATEKEAHGHKDWRLPTESELRSLCQNKKKGSLKATFNVSGIAASGGWYCSSSVSNDHYASGLRFKDGYQYTFCKEYPFSSVRLVRS